MGNRDNSNMGSHAKRVVIELYNGDKFSISSEVIIRDYALYYMDIDEITLEESLIISRDLLLSDIDELSDWAMNNMSWVDVEPHVTLIHTTLPDYHALYNEDVAFSFEP